MLWGGGPANFQAMHPAHWYLYSYAVIRYVVFAWDKANFLLDTKKNEAGFIPPRLRLYSYDKSSLI